MHRPVLSGVLAAVAILPAFLWLSPALFGHQALSFRDQGDFFYPLKLYTADRLRRGEIPLWNSLSGAGEPWLANLQSGVFYPPALFFLLPWPGLAAGLYLLFHFAVAAWGMRKFLKEEAVSEAGALFGTAAFCAGGFAASLSAYWNHFGGWAYLPGIAALARSGLSTRSSRAALVLLVGLSAMAGSPEMTGAALATALLFAAFPRASAEGEWADVPRGRSVSRTALATLLGLALAGWALAPMGELALRSDRRGPLPAEDREAGAAGVAAVSSVLGLSAGESGTAYLPSLFVGPLALVAAGAAYGERQRLGLLRLLTLLALAGIIVAAAGPPGSWARSLPPLDRIRYPAKALALTSFALAALAGLGADRLRFTSERTRRHLAIEALLGAAALALCLLSPLPPMARGAGAAGVAALAALRFNAGRFAWLGAALETAAALALVGSLALASRPLFTFVPEAEIRRQPPEIASLSRPVGRVLTPPMRELSQRALETGRFGPETLARQRESLQGYTNLLFGVSTIRTASALPTAGARAITDAIDTAEDPVRAAGPASVRLLWTPFRPARLPSQKIGEYFRAPFAPYRPRVSFVRAYSIEPDSNRAWTRVAGGEIDLTREVFLNREPKLRLSSDTSKPLLVVRLAEDLPERIVADVISNGPGLLVLTDMAYPGWMVQADGQPAELLVADGFFRAVPLPAGSHRVIFRYRSISFLAGAAVSLAAVLTLLFMGLGRPGDARSLL